MSILTDPAAQEPRTGAPGIDGLPVLILEKEYDITDEIISIKYRVGERASKAIAPACYVQSGNFTIDGSGTFWTLTPNDHFFTASSGQAKDIYHFGCYDLREWHSPINRSPCANGCGEYAVLAWEVGTYNWTPLSFTADIDTATDPHTLVLTGSTASIDPTKDYVITYGSYDACEPCQLKWIFHADDNNQIGTDNVPADRWV